MVDTNNDPGNVDYVIPGNDDAIRAVRLYIEGAASAVLDGRSTAAGMTAGREGEFVEVEPKPVEPKPVEPAAPAPAPAAE